MQEWFDWRSGCWGKTHEFSENDTDTVFEAKDNEIKGRNTVSEQENKNY